MKVTAGNWHTTQRSYLLPSQEQVKDQEQLKDQVQLKDQEQLKDQVQLKDQEQLKDQVQLKDQEQLVMQELPAAKETKTGTTGIRKQNDERTSDLDMLVKSLNAQSSSSSAKSGKMKPSSSSSAKSGVGELAAQLAQAQTKIDVQQIAGKAMRALVNLQMTAAMSEGSDKKKIQQQVARMKKLIKRINKKMQHLAKEEQMELKIKKAEKKQELEKAEEIQKELKTHRTKRRRDERNYASKELSRDRQEANNEMVNSLGGGASSPSVDATVSADAAAGVPAMSGDMMSLEPISLDISV